MKKMGLPILIVIGITIYSCSSSSYALKIDTEPQYSDVNIINAEGEVTYTTKAPAKILQKQLPEGDYTVVLSKPGYEETTTFKGNSKYKVKKVDLGTRTLKKSNEVY